MLSTQMRERAVRTVLAIRCRHDAQPGAVIQWYERRTIRCMRRPPRGGANTTARERQWRLAP